MLSEKYSEKNQLFSYGCFFTLEKAYDRVKREKLLKVMEGYRVNGELIINFD